MVNYVPGPIQSVERAAAMIRMLAAEPESMGLGQISSALGLAKGTTHGLLKTLQDVGFVDQEGATGRYRLGAEILHLGSSTLDLNELRTVALNWVDTLAARTGESAGISAYREGKVVVAHHVLGNPTSRRSVHTDSVLYLHASAMGKVLLAFDPGAARSIQGIALESLTFRTITERARLLTELADIRDAGCAASVEEVEPEVAEIAAPVRDHGGYVVAAVGVDGPVDRLCDSRLRPRAEVVNEVVSVARSISRVLGHGVAS